MLCVSSGLPAAAAERTIVPIADFMRDPDFQDVRISPDGVHLATTRWSQGHKVLQIVRVKDLEQVGAFGMKGDKDIEDLYWPNNEQVMFGWSRRLGGLGKAEQTAELMLVNVDGSGHKLLLGPEIGNALVIDRNYRNFDIVDLMRSDHERVLVSIFDFVTGMSPTLYSLSLKSSKKIKLYQADVRLASFLSDGDGHVRVMTGTQRDGTYVVNVRESEDASWKELGRYAPGGGWLEPAAFALDGAHAYLFGNVDAPTLGVHLMDFKGGKSQLVFRDPVYDAYDVIEGRVRNDIIGVTWEGARTEWKFFDEKHPDAQFMLGLRKALGGKDLRMIDFTEKRNQAVVWAASDVEPGSYFIVDFDKKALVTRLPMRPWIKPAQMAPKQPIEFKARDGLTIHGYITLPVDRAADQKLPMIVLPHGGPIGLRDHWRWDPEVQLLANRGYAVLQPNYRGSGGYGRDFTNAGMREYGGKMQDDVTDATRWAVQAGYADPARICIYGASYGAYAAMMGAIREPDLYRCAAGYAGRYDLVDMAFRSGASSYDEGQEWIKRAIGTDREELTRRSPAYNADKLRVPLFFAHGEDDHTCPIEQYKTLRSALRSAGKGFEEMVKEHEGHGFSDPKNVEEFYTRLLAFFDRHIGKPAAAKTAAN